MAITEIKEATTTGITETMVAETMVVEIMAVITAAETMEEIMAAIMVNRLLLKIFLTFELEFTKRWLDFI